MKFTEDKEAAALAQQRQENIAAFRAWLGKHPEIPYNEANLLAFEEYMDFTEPLSEADFEFALSNIPERRFARQRVLSVAEANAERRALSVSELRDLARRERPVPRPDELPYSYIPIGKKSEVELTADVLKRAGTRTGELSINDLKFLIRRFGASEVNKRLGVKPTIQPGHTKSVKI